MTMTTASPASPAGVVHPVIVHPMHLKMLAVPPEPRAPFMELCPDEVLHRVAAFLGDGASLARLRRVSKRCRAVVDAAEDAWRDACVREFNANPSAGPGGGASWRDLYRFNAALLCELFVRSTADAVRDAMLRRAVGGIGAGGAAIRLPGLGFAAV